MRTLDLQDDLYLNADGKPAVAHQARLCLRLQAYMAWPEDQVSRTQFLAANGARMMGNLLPIIDKVRDDLLKTDLPTIDMDPKLKVRILADIFKTKTTEELFTIHGGGFNPVADAALHEPPRANSFDYGHQQARLAGHRLLFTAMMHIHHRHQLRGGASLSKATDLLAHKRKQIGQAGTTKPIFAAWKTHQSVAHLAATALLIEYDMRCAGGQDAGTEHPKKGPLSQLLIHRCCISQALLDFGLSFVADRSEQPCLDPNLAYRFPVTLPAIDLAKVLPPLDEEDLDFLAVARWVEEDED